MREHFYNVVLMDKTGKELLNIEFGKDRKEALGLFYDLADMIKKTKAKLVLYEDKDTPKEREYLVN